MNKPDLIRDRRSHRHNAGFSMAALMFFLTAATLVITATVVPSWVMEAKREREKELVFRGEEYKHAIEKFQRTLNLLPEDEQELLASNGTRFLRRLYTDPVSGEPWRRIMLNDNGSLTGSNVFQTMGQVPTTTSQRNTQTPAAAPKATGGTAGATSGLGTGGGGLGAAGGGGGLGATAGGGLTGGGGRGATGTAAPTTPAPAAAQPAAQQAVPLHGMVGVGSGSRGNGVMIYNKQEQYSNWEFIAQLQQGGTGAGGAGGGGAAGGGAGGAGGRGGTTGGGAGGGAGRGGTTGGGAGGTTPFGGAGTTTGAGGAGGAGGRGR